MSDDEYEVESILRAKVAGGKRGKKKSWSYFVKWKNYGPDDNTWEPEASFKGGSEHFIEYFWDRVDTQGRDVADLRGFAAGEEFFISDPLGKKAKKTKERKEPPPASKENSESEHEALPRSTTSGKKKGKKAQQKEESPPPIVLPPDSEQEVGSLINDVVEEPVPSVSTRNKRRHSSVAGEEEPTRPKGKPGRPPGKRPNELEAELAQLELEPVIVDESGPPPTKRNKRGRPPGIPAREMGKQGQPQSVPVVDEPAPSAPKRKRGRPPGIPSRELQEQSQPIDDEPAPSAKRKRGPPGISSREMEKQTQSQSESVVNEPSPPLPKSKHGGRAPGIPSREIEKRVEPEPAVDERPPLPRGKRGRPPGKRPAELEAEEERSDKAAETEDEAEVVATSSPAKARRARSPKKSRNEERVVPDSRAESSRGRNLVTAEPSTSAPRRLSLPRRRGRLGKTDPPKKTPFSDELLIVPDSDEEKGKRKTQRGKKKGPPAEDAMDVDAVPEPASTFGAPTLLSPDPAPETSAEASPAPALPAHRLRAANPRVKVADDPHLTEVNGPDAIAVKAQFMKRATNGKDQASGSGRRAVVSGSKAGPGRSSATLFPENHSTRLTVQKGVLTSVKPKKTSRAASELEASPAAPNGDASMEIDGLTFDFVDPPGVGPSSQSNVEPEPEVAPTGQELLNAAGMDEQAVQDLPDFEEDAEGEIDIQSALDVDVEVQEVEPPRAFGSISAANGQGPDTPVSQAKPLTFASRVGMWSQSTIFGPLTLGLQGRSLGDNDTANASADAKRYTFHLNLDSAVSTPVTLRDVHASHTFLDGLDASARNPTGKFYKDNHAIALVDTLKAKGSYARVTPGEAATDDHQKHFERFISRLQSAELFIQMNRAETLVMCASDNAVLGQKLGFPPQLLGLGDTAVVAHVDVEDFSQYAEAAVHADTTRW